jgi:hypothetical protein
MAKCVELQTFSLKQQHFVTTANRRASSVGERTIGHAHATSTT